MSWMRSVVTLYSFSLMLFRQPVKIRVKDYSWDFKY